MAKLVLDWATVGAARYAVMHWHYSKRMPSGANVRIGVWEDDAFIGVVLFGKGASPHFASALGIPGKRVAELTRIALREHMTPVSRIIAIAVRLLRKQCPDIDALVSFADTREGHHGGIYQAAGWIFTGLREIKSHQLRINGKWTHPRGVTGRNFGKELPEHVKFLAARAARRVASNKYHYVLPLDSSVRPAIMALQEPYPKRVLASAPPEV